MDYDEAVTYCESWSEKGGIVAGGSTAVDRAKRMVIPASVE